MNRRNFLNLLGTFCVAPTVFIPKLIEVPKWKSIPVNSMSRHDLTFPEFLEITLGDKGERSIIPNYPIEMIPDLDFPDRAWRNSKHMDMAKGKSKTQVIKSGVDIHGEIYVDQLYDDVYADNKLTAREIQSSIDAMRERLFEKVAQAKLHNRIHGFS